MFSWKRVKNELHEDRITCSRWRGGRKTLLNFDENLGTGVLYYSVCFWLISAIVFCWFWVAKRTFVWQGDGWAQHYKALVYWGRYLRSLMRSLLIDHSFAIPEWDFAIGEGSDILTTLHYYVIGDPLCLLSAFVPTKYMWILYDLLSLVRMYLAGIVFTLFCFRTGQHNKYGVLAGSLTYTFCGWVLFFSVSHPYFVNPMIYLPLLLLGVEELIGKKRSKILICAVFLSACSNFYFFYLLVWITIIYTLVRLFMLCRTDFRGGLKILFRIAGNSLIGLVLSAVIVLPVMYAFASSSRLSVQYGIRLFYPLSHYSQIPGMFISNATSYSLYMAYSIAVIPALFLLFLKKNQYKILKVFFVICMVAMMFPIMGQALNGFSFITNRWCFAFALLVSYILTVMWNDLMVLSRREAGFVLLCSIGYSVLCLLLNYSRTEETMIALAMLFVFLCILIYTGNSESTGKKTDIDLCMYVRCRQIIMLGITVASILLHSFYVYSVDGGFIESRKLIREMEVLQKTEAEVVKMLGENDGTDGLYRYSGRNVTPNANLLAGVSSTDFYWSIANPYAAKFRELLGVGENSAYHYTNYDDGAALTSLAGVRYYAIHTEDRQPVPYGFSYINSFDVHEEVTAAAMEKMKKELGVEELSDSHKQSIADETGLYFSIFRNDYALPLTYAYDDMISMDTWNRLNRVEKQEALLQSVVIDQAGGLVEGQVALKAQSPSCTIICNSDEITQKENAFVVTAPGATVTLSFNGMTNSETYVLVNGLHYEGASEYELYFGDREKDPLNLYNETRWNLLSHGRQQEIIRDNLFRGDLTTRMMISMKSSSGAVKALEYTTAYYSKYCGRHDFTMNLGYAQEAVTDITISFPHIGTYSYDSIEVVCQPMENYPERIEALRRCTLEDMEMSNDTITGTIHADRDKWLCIAVPYSSGWRAYLDGTETVLHRANMQYMALRIPAGEHSVRLVYETPFLRIGLCISAVTAVVYLLYIAVTDHRRKRKNNISQAINQ